MHKIYLFTDKSKSPVWDELWSNRTINQELEACDIETAPRIMFLKYLDNKDKIIDAGCGFGKWVIFLKNKGYNIIGIDNNEYTISNLREYDSELQVKLGNILDLKFPKNSFDAYISMGVIEHFEDGPIPALKEAYRVLKPNGLLFVSTPTINIIRKIFGQSFLNLINLFINNAIKWIGNIFLKNKNQKRFKKKYKKFFEYRFKVSELKDYLKKTNFKIIEIMPHDFPGSKEHAIGLTVDLPFLKAFNDEPYKLNKLGKMISIILNWLSPWIACSSVLIVAKAIK
jgi:ubiquinone/menaquinone biosynthesis C-methylase UbiE